MSKLYVAFLAVLPLIHAAAILDESSRLAKFDSKSMPLRSPSFSYISPMEALESPEMVSRSENDLFLIIDSSSMNPALFTRYEIEPPNETLPFSQPWSGAAATESSTLHSYRSPKLATAVKRDASPMPTPYTGPEFKHSLFERRVFPALTPKPPKGQCTKTMSALTPLLRITDGTLTLYKTIVTDIATVDCNGCRLEVRRRLMNHDIGPIVRKATATKIFATSTALDFECAQT